MDELEKYIVDMKYMVTKLNETKLYNSLRNISNDIKVDFTTISKKLKDNNECFCKSKETKTFYFIKKVN